MSSRDAALRLIAQRDELERQIEQTRSDLAAQGVGLSDPLVAPDGFPRHDIDVATVRQLRVQLIRQENDMKALLNEISIALNSAFPPKQAGAQSPVPAGLGSKKPQPFCVVKSVVSGSLADEAGLKADDEILEFGSASTLAGMPDELKRPAGSRLVLQIVRRGELLELAVTVTPNRSLGCHVVPR